MKTNFGVKMTLLACALGASQGILPISSPVAHAQAAGRINVLLDGRMLSFGNVPPEQVSGRVLVPLRGVFEALGATLDFDPVTNKIFAVRGDTQIQLQIGSTQATVNGVSKTLDVPAQTRFNRTLVPLRFVSEALGADVSWNETQRTVSISTTGTTPVVTPTPVPLPPDTTYPGTTSTTLDGKVTRIYPQQQSFIIRTATGAVTVKLNTALPASLNAGDRVQASGYMQGQVLIASRVTVLRDTPTKFNATVISILGNRRLVVENKISKVRYTVETTAVLPQTIDVGDSVRVAGTFNGESFTASTVTLITAAPVVTGQAIDFLGAVASINTAAGSLQVRGDNGQLYTVYYARPGIFPIGTRVRVVGTYANGTTTARTITRP